MFDLKKSDVRPQAVFYGSTWYTGLEKKYHSFVNDRSCGRWAISKNKNIFGALTATSCLIAK